MDDRASFGTFWCGLYPVVTHKLSNIGKGAFGIFQAGDVEASGAGGY